MRVVVLLTLAAARAARNALDVKLGFPAPGVNAATGLPVEPGQGGWALTEFAVVKVTDVNGVYGAAGQTYFLLGPIDVKLEQRIQQLANPPTIVTVPNALMARGTRYDPSIGGWVANVPQMVETPVDFDG